MASLSQRFFSHSSTCGKLARTFSTSSHLSKNLRAGKIHNPKNFPVSYEVTWPPDAIGVKKAWNSWDTTNLHGEKGSPSVIFEDIFIRKFLEGTFPTMYQETTPIVIRRRQNLIDISIWMKESPVTKGIVEKGIPRLHFLHGYSEELLSRFLKCPVKLDIHCVDFDKVDKDTKF